MDFYEIDFLSVGSTTSGDAIALRYGLRNEDPKIIQVVDGGYLEDGAKLCSHIRKHYGANNGEVPTHIDHVVLTHPDGDHANGLRTILQEFTVGTLWMNRPWVYSEQLLEAFEYNYTLEGLRRRLRSNFPNVAALEDIADERGIEIRAAFSGAEIGAFTVLAPSFERFLQMVVTAERTPEGARQATILGEVFEVVRDIVGYLGAIWGSENLKGGDGATSRENEMSIVQIANICDRNILLTGDAGVEALSEAAIVAKALGVSLPDIKVFQVPHHGSRRNLNSDVLDLWLGERLDTSVENMRFSAPISAGSDDDDHPRKSILRAIHHRGGKPVVTKGKNLCCSHNSPDREGWSTAETIPYPDDQED